MSKIQKLIDDGKIPPTSTTKPSSESKKKTTQQTNQTIQPNQPNTICLVKSKQFNFDPTKPLLKWVGGKTQILEKLIGDFPVTMSNYHEFFIGGGSVLFGFLDLVNSGVIKVNGTINAYDLNSNLINMYTVVQNQPGKLAKSIKKIIKQYNEIEDDDEIKNKKPKTFEEAITSKESYYYWIRQQYNTQTKSKSKLSESDLVNNAAMFIFLNKTCFRGLYRTGPNGFNVPFGHYSNPTILDPEHLIQVSKLVSNVNFIHGDFSQSAKNVKPGDFVYMDPPYAPENATSFVGYTDGGFDLDTHIKLFTISNEFKKTGTLFIMSNADVKLVRDNFPGYLIESIECKRSINSKNPGAKTQEVIIKSFKSN